MFGLLSMHCKLDFNAVFSAEKCVVAIATMAPIDATY